MSLKTRHRVTATAIRPACFVETLEGRRLLSVSASSVAQVAVKPAAAIATQVALDISAKKIIIGQSLTLTVRIKPSGGGIATGSVTMTDDNKNTDITGTVNHLGYIRFTFGPADALWTGAYDFRAKYAPTGNFAASHSIDKGVSVEAPTLTNEPSGVAEATVTAGTGKGAKSGQTITALYTGFLTTGSVFDESADHTAPGTFSFVLDAPGGAIAGFNDGLVGIEAGETRVLVIPPSLGYGSEAQSGIPANSTLVFVVSAVSI